ncbi:MAG: peptidase S41, partial [Bacteroidales bacterium]|nr:peptidase S41 [Bacteroidales bacterium]
MKRNIFGMALLLAGCAFVSAQNAAQEPLWFTYPAISPDGQTIAFSHQGDLFTVPVAGGEARQITSNPAYEAYPVWSPDGSRIAFASDREGSLDIYCVDAKGGSPVRLTTHSGAEIPLAFTDKGTVLYRALEMETVNSLLFPGDYPQVYEVDLQGGRPRLFSAYPLIQLSLNPDGSLLYEDKKGYEDNWRKHHTSSVTRDIWLLKDGRHTRLTSFKGEDLNPIWAPDYRKFYYLSEENGTFNVYEKGLEPAAASTQITRFKTHPVRFLSVAKNGTLCFAYDGGIYTMQLGQEPVRLSVSITADDNVARLTKKIMRSGATEIAVSPKKNEVAFVLGGDVYVTAVDYATTKRITNTPQTERTIDFSPDGRSIAYASERDGVWQLYQATIEDKDDKTFTYAGKIKEERLTQGDETMFQPKYSPDGKELAFLRNRTEICVLDLKSGKLRTAMDGKYEYSYTDGDQDFSWSPDGKWILTGYIGTGGWNHKDLALVKADGSGEIHNLTNSGYSEGNGKFVLGGKAMLFESDRSGYRSHGSWGSEGDAYIMFFDKQAYEDFLKNKEERALAEERAKDDKKDGKKASKDSADAKKKVEDLTFDFDYLEDRTLRLTSSSDMLGDMVLSPKGDKLYYLAPHNGKIALWEKDLVEQKTELKIPGIGYGQFKMTDDGSEIFLLANGGIKKIKTASGSADNVEYEALYENRPFDMRAYLFSHIWRQVKDKFYDPTFRGMDWKAYFDHYERFLPYINNGYDFSMMVSELLGELNASHTGCRFYGNGGAMQTAVLGVFLDPTYTGDGLRIQEVLHNSPFALCGKEV